MQGFLNSTKVYICLGICGYVIGSCFSVLYSLINPLLSDQFGFSVSNISHFFVAISLINLSTTFFQSVFFKFLMIYLFVFLLYFID